MATMNGPPNMVEFKFYLVLIFFVGYRAIATPGEIAGYWLAFNEFGSGKIAWKDLVMPSVNLARNGIPVSEYLGYVLLVKEKHFRTLPSMQFVFIKILLLLIFFFKKQKFIVNLIYSLFLDSNNFY